MNKKKIIIDPVLGFIELPNEVIYDIFAHPFVQRLSRIRQLGLSFLVYPGATHTRFLHSVGTMHLMSEAINILKNKGLAVSQEELNAACVAILLHDIGHGPFSHVLEHSLVRDVTHEDISLLMMERIGEDMRQMGNGEAYETMRLAIDIFVDRYPRHFFHHLISSQLDVDRLDYLRRDAFFCGVQEGVVGSERIIKMLNVSDDKLVVDMKGIYSVEKFLLARRFMYLQVYLHKTSVAAEQMLLKILCRAKYLAEQQVDLPCSPALQYFLSHTVRREDFFAGGESLRNYVLLDDNDILAAIKSWSQHNDEILRVLSISFINRDLFKGIVIDSPSNKTSIRAIDEEYVQEFRIDKKDAHYFYEDVLLSAEAYSSYSTPIYLLASDGSLKEISRESEIFNIKTLTHKTSVRYHFFFNCETYNKKTDKLWNLMQNK